jgi:hypothetical protein
MKHCELFHPDDHDRRLQRDGQDQRARPFGILGFVCIDGFDFYFGKGPVMTGPPTAMAAAAETVPAAVVRATFGPPTCVYRFSRYVVDAWDVNLLTKMRE